MLNLNCRFRSWGGGKGESWDRDGRLDIAKIFSFYCWGYVGIGMRYIGREDGGMIVQGRSYGGLPDYDYSETLGGFSVWRGTALECLSM